MINDIDRRLIAITQCGLPIVPRPYDIVADLLGIRAENVRDRLQGMLAEGLVRRIGAVPNPYRLGYAANGMTVWDVQDDLVDLLGEKVGALGFVSHCYRRPRALPDWPYNLFAMVHGHTRSEVERQAVQIQCLLAEASRGYDILHSSRILKMASPRPPSWMPE